MAKKLRVAVLFGGQSQEHEVSLVSAKSVMDAMDRKKYQVVPIGITKNGQWIQGKGALSFLKNKEVGGRVSQKNLTCKTEKNTLKNLFKNIDIVFPVLHGPNGEDGTIQGVLELSEVPYVGAGVAASAVGMNKILMNKCFVYHKLPVTDFIYFNKKEWQINPARIVRNTKAKLGYPAFVKPASLGSSVGISKSRNTKELKKHIAVALKYDLEVIVEKAVRNAREIECSVIGNEEPRAAPVLGEVVPSNEFYDYDAKYVDGKSEIIIPADLPQKIINQIRKIALEAYPAIGCEGFARVDFLVKRNSHKIYLSEINSIPGFTSISMFPKLWEASGLSYPRLIDKLIKLGIERFKKRQKTRTFYKPKKDWYR